MLAGNANGNRIYAGSGGASLWGGNGGYDYLYGGAGVDTFIAGDGEGSADIWNCSDEDIVYLHNITPADVDSITLRNAGASNEYIRIQTVNETNIYIQYDTDTTSTTTVLYADGTTTQYDHASGGWSTLGSFDADSDLWGGNSIDDAFIDGDENIRADSFNDDVTALLNTDLNALSDKTSQAVDDDITNIKSVDALTALMLQFTAAKRHSSK